MKLLQRILSRGLLISLAILAAIGYHFRTELFPERFGAPAAGQQQAAVEAEPAIATTPSTPVEDPPASVPNATARAETDLPDTAAPEPESMEAAPLEQVEPVEMAEPADAIDAMAPPVVEAQTEPESTTVPMQASAGDVADSDVLDSDVADLDAARQAFWARDFDNAERLYQQVAANQTSNADPLGELGNLYYLNGRWREAAEAYAGAVERLIAAGDTPRAQHLLMVLDGLDAQRAQELRQAL